MFGKTRTAMVLSAVIWGLTTTAPGAQRDAGESSYYLKMEQGWQKIPFFCEEEDQVGVVNVHGRENYFSKETPFEFKPFEGDWGTLGLGSASAQRYDVFGKREVY